MAIHPKFSQRDARTNRYSVNVAPARSAVDFLLYFNINIVQFVVALVLCLSSCNDIPSSVGSALAPIDASAIITVSSDTANLMPSAVVGRFVPLLSSELAQPFSFNPAFLGAALVNDMPQNIMSAATFISFDTPVRNDSLRDALYGGLSEENVESASLLLNPGVLMFGDSLRQSLSFRVHALTRQWYNVSSPQTISLDDPALIGRQIGSFQDATTENGGRAPFKSLSRKTRIELNDKRLILRWLKAGLNSWPSVDGVALVPNLQNSRLLLALTDRASIVIRLKGDMFASGDTVVTISELARSSIVRAPLPDNSEERSMVVQGASALRTRLSFDFSSLPPFASIHRAELILPVDTARSTVGNLGFPGLIYLYPEKNATFPTAARPFESQRNTLSEAFATGVFDNTTGTARYIFGGGLNMTSVVENIVKDGGRKNMILQLRPEIIDNTGPRRSDEEQTATRIVFHPLRAANPELRPRLVVTYSARYALPR